MTPELCTSCRTRPAVAHGWCKPCNRRWITHGRPATGPPPPMSHAERTALSNAARGVTEPEPDPYDLEQARLRRARRDAEPDERVYRAALLAADLARVVQSRDRYGVRELFARIARARNADEVLIAFAACADPELLRAGPDEGERRTA